MKFFIPMTIAFLNGIRESGSDYTTNYGDADLVVEEAYERGRRVAKRIFS